MTNILSLIALMVAGIVVAALIVTLLVKVFKEF